jgi:hypothetical protein
MAYKVLGQSYPTAATATTLYTVPSAKESVVSTINVCNQSTAGDSIRIAIRPNGDTLATQHYIAYNEIIPGNSSIAYTIGITIDASDVITVYSNNGTSSFNAFGSEN